MAQCLHDPLILTQLVAAYFLTFDSFSVTLSLYLIYWCICLKDSNLDINLNE